MKELDNSSSIKTFLLAGQVAGQITEEEHVVFL